MHWSRARMWGASAQKRLRKDSAVSSKGALLSRLPTPMLLRGAVVLPALTSLTDDRRPRGSEIKKMTAGVQGWSELTERTCRPPPNNTRPCCVLHRWRATRKRQRERMKPHSVLTNGKASSPRHPTPTYRASSRNGDCQISTSGAAAAAPGSRQTLSTAHQLLLSHDRSSSPDDYDKLVEAYTLALRQAQSSPGQLDVAACFVAHIRLAQLSLGNNNGYGGGSGNGKSSTSSSSRVAHLESAWNLRHHLPPPLLRGTLGFYFRAVGLKLAALYDEQDAPQQSSNTTGCGGGGGGGGSGRGCRKFESDVGDGGGTDNGSCSERTSAVLRCVAELGVSEGERSREVKDRTSGGDASAAGATTGAVKTGCGRDVEALSLVCDGCGATRDSGGDMKAAAPAAVAAERGRDRGGGWYCRTCTEAHEKAVAQGPVSDGTPCAGCDDRTQPVTIEPDGEWYCEACIEEFYEEQAEQEKGIEAGHEADASEQQAEQEEGTKAGDTVDSQREQEEQEEGRAAEDEVDAKHTAAQASSDAESEAPGKADGAACGGGQAAASSAEGSTALRSRDWAISC